MNTGSRYLLYFFSVLLAVIHDNMCVKMWYNAYWITKISDGEGVGVNMWIRHRIVLRIPFTLQNIHKWSSENTIKNSCYHVHFVIAYLWEIELSIFTEEKHIVLRKTLSSLYIAVRTFSCYIWTWLTLSALLCVLNEYSTGSFKRYIHDNGIHSCTLV